LIWYQKIKVSFFAKSQNQGIVETLLNPNKSNLPFSSLACSSPRAKKALYQQNHHYKRGKNQNS
jgi:hypothetical protein